LIAVAVSVAVAFADWHNEMYRVCARVEKYGSVWGGRRMRTVRQEKEKEKEARLRNKKQVRQAVAPFT